MIPLPVDAEGVARIAAIDDPVLRNRWITQAYHDIAVALLPVIGAGNATWTAFGVWASATAGVSIRMEEFPPRFRHMITSSLFYKPAHHHWGAALEHAIDDAIAAVARTVSHAVADGNRIVFAELAPPLMALAAGSTAPEPPVAEAVTKGVAAYRQAGAEPNPGRRAQFVFLANLELVLHEQRRLQPYISQAMDAAIADLIHDSVRSRHPAFDSSGHIAHEALKALEHLAENAWERVATDHFMTLTVPGEVLHLARDIPELPGLPRVPADLAEPVVDGLPELLATYDRTAGTGLRSGARDWAILKDRMNYVTSLFRARQHDQRLLEEPFTKAELEEMQASA